MTLFDHFMVDPSFYAFFLEELSFVGKGLGVTLMLTLGGLSIGCVLGTLITFARYKKYLERFWGHLISLIRGTPLILQLGFFYYALPYATGLKLDIVAIGLLAFGINSSVYMAEILMAGIKNVPQGQFEAAKVLGIPEFFAWRDIIFPQILKNIHPSLVHEAIALLKETALISTLGGMDIMRRAQILANENFSFFAPLLMAGFYYYLLVLITEALGRQLQKQFSW